MLKSPIAIFATLVALTTGQLAGADRAPWTGDPMKPQQSAPRPPSVAATSGADAATVIGERQKKRDQYFKDLQISPFTSLGVHPIDAHKQVRVGGDDHGIEVDPNTAKPNVINVMVDGSGAYVTAISGGEALRLRRTRADGDLTPGEGEVLTGLRRLGGKEIVSLARFDVVIAGGAKGGNLSLYDPLAPARAAFTGFKWFPPAPSLQIRAPIQLIPNPDRIGVATSDGRQRDYYRFGIFHFEIGGKAQSLTALARAPKIDQGATLFIPFKDATNGHETYANGRYIELKYEGADSLHLLDFNRSINPYCNYSPWYSCPIPPKENTLSLEVRAGEMTYPHAD